MKQYLILFLLAISSLLSCKKDSQDNTFIQHDMSAVSGPASGAVNEAVVLTVSYPYSNGCDVIDKFEQETNGSIVSIKAYSKPVPKNAVCTQDTGTKTTSYNFVSSTTGTFELRFFNRDGSFISHTIVVQ